MPSADSESPDETFFNDLSQQGLDPANEGNTAANGQEARKDDAASKQKRIACVLCRKRKLRCDGTRPTCGTCKRLSHDCTYDEVRKKSGPKRGYVKLLEARLRTCRSNHSPNDRADWTHCRASRDSSQDPRVHRQDPRVDAPGLYHRLCRQHSPTATTQLERILECTRCRP